MEIREALFWLTVGSAAISTLALAINLYERYKTIQTQKQTTQKT